MSTNQVIVKPEDLRKFASQLKTFNQQLDSSTMQLQVNFKALETTWRDQEQRRFASEFEQTMKVLKKFMETSEKHIPFLIKKAKIAEEFLRSR